MRTNDGMVLVCEDHRALLLECVGLALAGLAKTNSIMTPKAIALNELAAFIAGALVPEAGNKTPEVTQSQRD